ncbi:MAG: FHA domain-containing protein [Proteobacteria bacterium]|nr:FHA domain-containing protein [Pseudomonadota bacterium]
MRTAIAGTAILLVMAVLTLSTSHGGAKNLAEASGPIAVRMEAAFWESFEAAPALMLGLIIAVALPALATLAQTLKPLTRARDATRRYRPGRNDEFDADASENRSARCCLPFVEIENGRGMRCAIRRDMLRIGREDDNDIRIPSRYVHRYHDAIHREDNDDWHITDLTGVESNGLIVNGKRCCEARLRDGDLIQLGPGKLRFRAGAG